MHRREFMRESAALAGWGWGLAMADPVRADATSEDFADLQVKKRQELWNLLGDLPEKRPPKAKLLKTEKSQGYVLEHLELDLNGKEAVPAYLLLPDRRQDRAPGLLYIHAHGGTYELGKEELILGRKVLPAYAPVCAAKGLVTLAIDSWCFSGRKRQEDGRNGEWDTFKLMLWKGQVLWGMMMFDEFQAVSYLAGRPEVDAKRIGAFGLSLGTNQAGCQAAPDPPVHLQTHPWHLCAQRALTKNHNV